MRLVALWVLAESVLGGLLHGLKLPVTGFLVGGSAMICIILIAGYFPKRGSVLNAMMLVMLMKFSLSPHSPFPAYLAVLFQGLAGEFLLRGRKYFLLKCLLFGFLGMMESALQRLLVLVFISGTEIWDALDIWVQKLSFGPEHISAWLAGAYLMLHALAGLLVGRIGWAMLFGKKTGTRTKNFTPVENANLIISEKPVRKIGIAGPVLSLLAFLVYFAPEMHLLPWQIHLPFMVKLLLRIVWLYGLMVFLIVPLLDILFKKILSEKAAQYTEKLEEVRRILPEIAGIAASVWSGTSDIRPAIFRPFSFFNGLVQHVLPAGKRNRILTGDKGQGKSTAVKEMYAGKPGIDGIITVRREGDLRDFHILSKGESWSMQGSEDYDGPWLEVGRFRFSDEAFRRASQYLLESARKPETRLLVIDEIGPLELRGLGFAEVLKQIIEMPAGPDLLLVVRSGLEQKVREYFWLTDAQVIDFESGLSEA